MKKLLIVFLSIVLMLSIVSCDKNVSTEEITNSTKEVWDNSTQNESIEQVSFKNLNIGGVMTIDNLVFDIEKKFKDGKLLVNIETSKNMSIKINEDVKGIIDMVLDYKKLEGDLKVKHLEQAWSKVGLKANFEFDDDTAAGTIQILNVKDMFKANLAKPVKYEFKFDNLKNNEDYKAILCELNCHPITTYIPTNKDTFNLSKEVPVSCEFNEFCHISDNFLARHCENCINKSNYTLKHILFDTFADTTASGIFKNAVNIENPTAKFKTSIFSGKKYIDSVNVKSKLKVNISKEQLEIAAKDLSEAYDNPKMHEIYSSIISILNYDSALIEGDMDILITNRIVK